MPARNAATTPTPPPFGIGRVCALRESGWSKTPAPVITRTMAAENRASVAQNSRCLRSDRVVTEGCHSVRTGL